MEQIEACPAEMHVPPQVQPRPDRWGEVARRAEDHARRASRAPRAPSPTNPASGGPAMLTDNSLPVLEDAPWSEAESLDTIDVAWAGSIEVAYDEQNNAVTFHESEG